MSGILRRIAALLLGVIVGVAGGVFWSYQNIKPLQMIGKNDIVDGTEISDASVEELAELIVKATKNPDEFSFARLEKEYGIDLKKILKQAGIDTENANEEDMNALQNISLLSIMNGAESFLDNIKLRALYVILPSVMDKDLDEILSKEAQATLGDYTLWQLLNSDAATEELGLITALKALKVGALLPSVFDANYNADKHEYTYTVKEDSSLKVLNLIADVPLKGVIDLANGADPVKSLMEGELRVLGDKPLTEALSTLFSIAGSETQKKLDRFTRVLGDSKLSDLFTLKGDKYVLTFDKVVEEIDFGYIFGFEKGKDGTWYKDATMTEPVDGLLEMLANLDLKALTTADGDVIKTINAVIGDMSITTVFETFVDNEKIPAFVQALGDLTVRDILRNGTKEIVPTLIENLSMYVGDWTLGQALDDILKPADKQKIEESVLLSGLMNLRFGDFLKEKYTADTFIDGFDNALGEIELGALFGKTKVDGKWQGVNNIVGIAFDITVGDIFDVVRADNYTEAVKALFGSITIGDLYGAIFDYTITDEDPIYHKGDKHVSEGFNEFLNLEFWKLMASFDKNSGYNIINDVKKLTVGDVLYSGLGTFMNVDKWLSCENGEIALTGSLERYGEASKVFLNETIGNYKANYKNGPFWEEKLRTAYNALSTKDKYIVLGGATAVCAVLYEVDNPLLVKIVKNVFGEDATWYKVLGKTFEYTEVDGKYVGKRFYNSFMDKFLHANIAETLTKGYPFLTIYKGDITLGNIITAVDKFTVKIEKSLKKEFIASDDGTPTISGDLINLLDIALDIPLSRISRVDGKIRLTLPYQVNDLMMGDLFAFYANGKSNTGFKATLSEDRKTWTVESQKLQEVYNNFFNLTVWQVRKEKNTLVKEILGDSLLSELVSAFDTTWQNDSFLTHLYSVKAIDFIDLVMGQKPLKDVYGDVTVGEALASYITGNLASDAVISATMDLTIGQIADVFTATSKKVAVKALVFDLYRDLYIRDFANMAAKLANMDLDNYINKMPTGKKLINKVLDYQVGYFEGAVKAQIKEMLNNLYLGDLVSEMATKVDNRFAFLTHNITENADGTYLVSGDFEVLANKLYNLSFGDMYKMFLNKTELRDYIYSYKVGDFGADIARMGYNYVMKQLGSVRRHAFTYDGENYIASGDFAVAANRVYNLSVEQAYKMLRDRTLLRDFVAEFKVGDFTAELVPAFYNKFMKSLNRTHTVEYVNGEYVASGDFALVSNRVYNLTLLEAFRMLKTPANLKEFIGGFKVGDFIGQFAPAFYNKFMKNYNRTHTVEYVNGEYVASGDFALVSNRVYNLTILEAFRMLKTPANLKEFIGEFKLGDFAYDPAPVVFRKFFGKYGVEHNIEYLNGEYVVTGEFEALGEKLYNLTILDAFRMFKDTTQLRSFVGDFKVGDVTATFGNIFVNKFVARYNKEHIVTYADGVYSVQGVMPGFFAEVYNLTGHDLVQFYRHPSTVLDKFNRPMGAYLRYVCAVLRRFDSNEFTMTIVRNEDGTYSAEGNYAFVLSKIINIDLKDFVNNLRSGKMTYLRDEVLAGVRVGHLLNKGKITYDEATDTWYVIDGGEVDFGSDGNTVITKKLYGLHLNELTNLNFAELFKDIKFGYLLGYDYDETLKVWVNAGSLVEGAMGKIANYTVDEITNNLNYIISNELTFGDVLDEATLNSNEIFKYLENTTLANATEELYKMKIGTLMGYEERGSYWYRNGQKVDDEVLDVLADYCYGQFAGATGYELYDKNGNEVTFMKHLMDNMSQNITVKTLYPDAGNVDADGFNALLDPNWKLEELPDQLMNKLQTSTSIEQLIKLGVFGDYFVYVEGEDLTKVQTENFVNMDKVFRKINALETDEQAREMWLNITMPEFMTNLMGYVTSEEVLGMQDRLENLQKQYDELLQRYEQLQQQGA